MFVGREEELRILNKRYESDRFEFGYLYGQRRIGKTSLIDEFSKDKNAILLFASDSDDVSIRRDFSRYFFEQTGQNEFAAFNSWDDFFIAIRRHFKDGKGLVVIDEYPNIVIGHDGKRKKTDFVSKFQNAIDHVYKDSKILFIITGSNVTFMKKEIKDTNAPLYKRHTFELMLTKLEWNDGVKMLDGMKDIDKIKILSITDTYPYYLSQIDTSLDFRENINHLFFDRDSIFVSDPSKIITSEIVASGFYSSIMRSISEGYNTISSISEVLNVETAKVSTYLDVLLTLKVVSKNTVFESKRLTYYKIIDRMCSFYFRFVFANSERIKLGYGKLIREKYENQIDTFLHHAFEDVCISYLEYLNRNGRLDSYYETFQNYKVENSKLGRSVEVDIVSSSPDGLLMGECKLTSQKKTIFEYEKMKEDASIEPFNKFKNINYYIFSSNGFEGKIKELKDKNLHLIDLNEMFR